MDDTTILATGEDLEAFSKLEQIMTRDGGALEWSQKSKCRYALNKFGLMGFTRRREADHSGTKKTKPAMRPNINLPGQTIRLSASHKFLGVILDQELWFKEQGAYALDKGTKWTKQYRWLAKGINGISAKHMTTFYFTTALPKMLYAADLFLIPGSKKTKGTAGYINKLARVHRQALLSITGAMNTTATVTLEAHANILPFRVIERQKILREALRLASNPPPLQRNPQGCPTIRQKTQVTAAQNNARLPYRARSNGKNQTSRQKP